MLSRLLTTCVLFAALAAGQTTSAPVEFRYDKLMLATEVTVQNGIPVLSNYQGGIILQVWTQHPEVNYFVAWVGYRLPGATKVLYEQLIFPRNPNGTQGSASAVFGPDLNFEVHSVFVLGVRKLLETSRLYPAAGVRY